MIDSLRALKMSFIWSDELFISWVDCLCVCVLHHCLIL